MVRVNLYALLIKFQPLVNRRVKVALVINSAAACRPIASSDITIRSRTPPQNRTRVPSGVFGSLGAMGMWLLLG